VGTDRLHRLAVQAEVDDDQPVGHAGLTGEPVEGVGEAGDRATQHQHRGHGGGGARRPGGGVGQLRGRGKCHALVTDGRAGR
jgi:hypothetical protein